MTDYIRRLVSGNKARFKDDILHLELDLVYITDKVIIMGYPAVGVEGLYRNRREDVLQFLKFRHGKNFWVFNFCPMKENSYDPSVFDGRVSRYPFPDHHAPPLAIIALAVRGINEWLKRPRDRVAVLHCKAGKGRSGTMACAYLLAMEALKVDQPLRSGSDTQAAKDWASRRMHNTVQAVADNVDAIPPNSSPIIPPSTSTYKDIFDFDIGHSEDTPTASSFGSPTTAANPEKSFTDTLKGVLDLHTAKRMKPANSPEKVKHGVSIPSQRRYLYYWALMLTHDGPKHLWPAVPPVGNPDRLLPEATFTRENVLQPPKVRITGIKLRMRESSSVRMGVVKAVNMVISKTKLAKGPGTPLDKSDKGSLSCIRSSSTSSISSDSDIGDSKKSKGKAKQLPRSEVWASIARYDDEFVDVLEDWEIHSRNLDGNMAMTRYGSDFWVRTGKEDEDYLSNLFMDGRWDKGKMVRSFARMGDVDGTSHKKVVDNELGKLDVYDLRLLSNTRWESVRSSIEQGKQSASHETADAIQQQANEIGVSHSEANSVDDIAAGLESEAEPLFDEGLIVNAGREVRIKLYLGQIFMCWLWFIPTFHMPQPPPTPNERRSPDTLKAHLILARKDLDFPLGIGSSIVDVDIEMEWVIPAEENPTDFSAIIEQAMNKPKKRSEPRLSQEDSENGQSQLATIVPAFVRGTSAGVSGVQAAAVEGKEGECVK